MEYELDAYLASQSERELDFSTPWEQGDDFLQMILHGLVEPPEDLLAPEF